MIYKWAFVRLDFFQEMLGEYLAGDPIYDNKIIEVQNLGMLLLNNDPTTRVYFSRYSKVQDWEEYNPEMKQLEEFIKEKEQLGEIIKNSVDWRGKLNKGAAMFMVPVSFSRQELLLYPLVKDKDVQECVTNFVIDSTVSHITSMIVLPMYLSKRENGWEYMNTRGSDERYVRIRTIDVKDWKKMMDKAFESGDLDGCDDDLQPSEVRVDHDGLIETMKKRISQMLQ